jgi:hypothetical protein
VPNDPKDTSPISQANRSIGIGASLPPYYATICRIRSSSSSSSRQTAQNDQSWHICRPRLYRKLRHCTHREPAEDPKAHINAYCRNWSKLLRLLLNIKEGGRVNVFEGNIHDIDLLPSCVRDCRAVFLCVSVCFCVFQPMIISQVVACLKILLPPSSKL